jgi:hypothetical protein
MSFDAMKQAVEALETLARYSHPETKIQVRKPRDGGPIVTMYPHKVATEAADALRLAIEQAERQEPVAWEDVLGAIARGWTHPENARKPMDVELAVAIAKEIQDMYAALPQHDFAYQQAVSLAKAIFKKHFAHEEHYASGRIVWKPLDTTAGVISQIDNMTCRLVAPPQQCPRCGKTDPAEVHTCTPKQEPVASLLEQNTMLDAKLAELERVNAQLLEALEQVADAMPFPVARAAIANAIRARGEKK